ncbi:MAG TPA: tetratricopeptide repeat protein [Humisphaera sp.]
MGRLTDRHGRRRFSSRATAIAIAAAVAGVTPPIASVPLLAQPAPANQADPAANLLRAAFGLYDRQLFKQAGDEFQKFLTQFPTHPEATNARYSLGVCKYRLNDMDGAVAALDEVVKDPKFPLGDSALAILGHAHITAGRYPKAVEALDLLVARYPQSKHAEVAMLQRAQALQAAGTHEPAVAAAKAFAKRFPQSPHLPAALFCQGVSEKALNQDKEAAATLTALLAATPKFDRATDARLVIGQALEAQSDVKGAAEQYKLMLDGAARDRQPDAHYSLGAALYKLGEFDKAAEQFKLALDKRPATPGADGKVDRLAAAARLQLGLSQLAARNVKAARPVLAAVAKDDADNAPAAKYGLAQCDVADGNFKDALAAFDALDKLPTPPVAKSQILFDRAGCLAQLNDHEAAAKAFASFVADNAKSPLLPEATYRRAFSLHQLKRYDESHKLVATLAGMGKHDFAGPAADLDAENLFLLPDYKEAAKAYEALLPAAPTPDRKSRIQLRLGQCAYSQADYKGAVEHLAPLATNPKAAADEVLGRGVFLLGDAHLQLKQYAEAAAALQKYVSAIRTGGGEPADKLEAQYKLAIAQLRGTAEGATPPATARQLLTTVAGGPADSPWPARAAFELGQLAYQAKPANLKDAAAQFNKVLSANAGKPPADLAGPALYYLGWIDLDGGDAKAAAAKWQDVATKHAGTPVAAEAAFYRGIALKRAGDIQAAYDALAAYAKATPDGKHAAESKQLAAACLIALKKDYPEAVKLLSPLVADKSLPADVVLYDLAWAQKGANDKAAAADAYAKLVKDVPASPLAPAARTELASLLIDDNKHAEALPLLQAVVDAKDAKPDVRSAALYRLGLCQDKLGATEKAAEAFATFAKEFPAEERAADALLQAGVGYSAAKRYDDAERQLAEFLKRFPDHASAAVAQLKLAEAQGEAGKFDASLASHQRFLQEFPKSEFAHRALFGVGWASENLKQYKAARDAYAKVTATHNGETAARAQYQVGQTYAAEGNHEEAAKAFLAVEDVYAYPAWSAKALSAAGRSFEALKQPEQAKKAYETVVTKYKDQAPEAKAAQARLADLK